MRLFFTLFLCLSLLSIPLANAQCVLTCSDISYIVDGCDHPVDVVELTGSMGCSYKIFDFLGNELTNPVTINANTACIPIRVMKFNGTDTCISNITLKPTQLFQLVAPDLENVSVANYEAGRVPNPETTDCIGGEIAFFATDEIIGLCNQVPRIRRTWKAIDQCGNPSYPSSGVSDEFNLVGFVQCHIIGADRVGIGQSITVRSNLNLRHVNPFQVQWTVIGDGWTIDGNKLDPGEATLRPGNLPGNATVMFDIFDQLGCVRHCERVFTSSYRGRIQGVAAMTGSDLSVRIRSGFATIHVDESILNPYLQIIDYMGKTYMTKKIPSGWNDVSINELNPGLYYIKVSHKDGIISKAFIKS